MKIFFYKLHAKIEKRFNQRNELKSKFHSIEVNFRPLICSLMRVDTESHGKISIKHLETISLLHRYRYYIDRKADAETFEKRRPGCCLAPVISRVCRSCSSLVLFPRSYPGRNLIRLPFESSRLEPN